MRTLFCGSRKHGAKLGRECAQIITVDRAVAVEITLQISRQHVSDRGHNAPEHFTSRHRAVAVGVDVGMDSFRYKSGACVAAGRGKTDIAATYQSFAAGKRRIKTITAPPLTFRAADTGTIAWYLRLPERVRRSARYSVIVVEIRAAFADRWRAARVTSFFVLDAAVEHFTPVTR